MFNGWKTLIFALLTAVIGVLQATDIAALIPNDPSSAGIFVTGIGVAAAVLRFMTNGPVGGAK